MGNKLVSLNNLKREEFNLEKGEINSVADFMRIYLRILHLALQYQFIDEEQRDGIAKSILAAVNKFAGNEPIRVSNFVYIVSMRLFEMSNFDAWELLKQIKNQEKAEMFILDTKNYFESRLNQVLKKVELGYKNSLELRNSFIISTWESCRNSLKLIYGCLKEGSTLELKGLHNCNNSEIIYITIQSESGITYLDRMEDYIDKLFIETSILSKIDAGKIMKEMAKEKRKSVSDNSEDLVTVQMEYEDAVKKLYKIDSYFTKKLQKISNRDEVFRILLIEFEEAHPDMDNEEMEDAFEEYWTSCPEYFPGDYSEIKREYMQKKAKQERIIEKLQSKLDDIADMKATMQKVISEHADDISLSDILKEYTIVELFKAGKISFPKSLEEKNELLLKISSEMATKVFLKNEADKLSLEEKKYFEKVIKMN